MSHFLGKQMLILVCHVCLKFKRNSQFKTRLSKTADSRLNINASWVLPLILLVPCLTLSRFHQALHCFRRSHNCKTGQNQFIQGYTSNDSKRLFDDQLNENNGFTLEALNPGFYLWFSWFHVSLSSMSRSLPLDWSVFFILYSEPSWVFWCGATVILLVRLKGTKFLRLCPLSALPPWRSPSQHLWHLIKLRIALRTFSLRP